MLKKTSVTMKNAATSFRGARSAKRNSVKGTLRWASRLSPMSIIQESRHGLRARILKNIQQETGFSSIDLAEYLQINQRTMQRYLQQNTLMNPDVSERALLVAQIAERGREVFGNDELFKLWLYTPSSALGAMPPSRLLNSMTGMQLVKAEMNRIEHGVY
jgi:putative toxin-antitoxin system antitoxin component (TIGR02293 family)